MLQHSICKLPPPPSLFSAIPFISIFYLFRFSHLSSFRLFCLLFFFLYKDGALAGLGRGFQRHFPSSNRIASDRRRTLYSDKNLVPRTLPQTERESFYKTIIIELH